MKTMKPDRMIQPCGHGEGGAASPPRLATGPDPAARRAGYTMIEFMGVLAIMAILASMCIPVVLNNLDAAAVAAETSNLGTINNALEFQITHSFQIPSETNWASYLANSLMVPSGSVAKNSRGYNRAYVYDTAGFGLTLPYTQGNGLAAVPPNPRLMIISCLSTNIPAAVNGGISSNDFTAIWNAAPGTIPNSSLFNNWPGKGGDLVIQRLNLQPLFCRVVLNAIDTNDFGSVQILSGSNASPVICICTNVANTALSQVLNVANGALSSLGSSYLGLTWLLAGPAPTGPAAPQTFTAWYLQGTVLNLYDTNSVAANGAIPLNLESQTVVQNDCSYVFEDEAWRGLLTGWGTNGPGSINTVIGVVGQAAAAVVAATCVQTEKTFKSCPLDYNDYYGGNHGDSCTAMSGCFHTFMQDYSSWCDEGFGTGSDNACSRLANDCNAVYNITQNMCQ